MASQLDVRRTRWGFLRVFMALALALLTVPFLGTSPALAGEPGVCDTNKKTGKIDSFMQNTESDGSGEWANGNMNDAKAELAEGDMVPQRVVMTELKPGENELAFTYDVYVMVQGDILWAYDYLANQRMDGAKITRWYIENATGPKATAYVTFEVPEGTTTATLYYDAHIASELDHGAGSGAGSIKGSPYHGGLVSLNCASSGANANQIMASAIDAGELTIIKDAMPADGTDFRFSITPGGDASTFSLDDDADSTLPDRLTYRVAPGTYTVEELDLPAGWNLAGIACSKAASGSTSTSRTVTIADDEKVSCTFTNSKSTSLRVDKEWVVNGAEAVPEGQQPGEFTSTLTLDGVEEAWGEPYPGYAPGAAVVVGEKLGTLPQYCSWGDPDADLGSRTLAGGANTVTITNVVDCDASLTVEKKWVIDGVAYDHATLEAGFSATLELDGVESGWGETNAYTEGETVLIAETVDPLPAGCVQDEAGEGLGEVTLERGPQTVTVTNVVDCGASLKVDKEWVVNGAPAVPDGQQPDEFTSTLTLDDTEHAWGQEYPDYSPGDVVAIGEELGELPEHCSWGDKDADLGHKTLAGGVNWMTITNVVDCDASLTVDKEWVIDGVTYGHDDAALPEGFSATLELDGVETGWGQPHAYTEGETVLIEETVAPLPAGCVQAEPGSGLGGVTLARGPQAVTITNVVDCGASLTVAKEWVINGAGPFVDGMQPEEFSATLTLDGVDKTFGAVYGGYDVGETVRIGEEKGDLPDYCEWGTPDADLGDLTLKRDDNTVVITNRVDCSATLTVQKEWVINGAAAVPDGEQPDEFSATLTLDGVDKQFGTEHEGFDEGETVDIGESVVLPDGCFAAGDSTDADLGQAQLARGENLVTITNVVNCGASLEVDKEWVINGGAAVPDGEQPDGFSATLTLDDADMEFGAEYPGYIQGDTVTIGEKKGALPDHCTWGTEDDDLGRKQLVGGLNRVTVTNVVNCSASVRVDKLWVVNGVAYDDGHQPDEFAASLSLSGNEWPDEFGVTYPGYREGDSITIGETTPIKMPQGCTNTATGDIGTAMLEKGPNVFQVTNTVTCGTSVEIVKRDAANQAPLDGAEFQLYLDRGVIGSRDEADVKKGDPVLTGSKGFPTGTYRWEGLAWDSYIVVETRAPSGYDLSASSYRAFTLGAQDGLASLVSFTFLNSRVSTPPPTPPVPTDPGTATVEVLKLDDETKETLKGAEFQAYADNGSTVGALDNTDTPIGAPVVTDDKGLARWTGLSLGSYLFEEVAAPEGYGLAKETVQVVRIGANSSGGVIRLIFLDPAKGKLAISKAAFEYVDGEWVASDGVVEFGDQVKYVVTVAANGPKIHRDVVVSDFVPGYDPDDTTSDTEGVYVTGTGVCIGGGRCAVSLDEAEQLLSWELGDMRGEARSVEFVIEFPTAVGDSGEGQAIYTETLANTAAASWSDSEGVHEIDSNEVVVVAGLEILPVEDEVPPPAEPRPPTEQPRPPAVILPEPQAGPRPSAEILPDTGAPSNAGLWTTLGGLMVALGSALLVRRRRDAS